MGAWRQTSGGRWVPDEPVPGAGPRTTWPAFSVRQPWAHMAVTIPFSQILRPYSTQYVGPALVHASSVMATADWYNGQEFAAGRHLELPPPDDLPRGGVVGACRIVRCIRLGRSRWAFDLADVIAVPFCRASGDFEVFELAGGRPCCQVRNNAQDRGSWTVCRSCGFPIGFHAATPAAAGANR